MAASGPPKATATRAPSPTRTAGPASPRAAATPVASIARPQAIHRTARKDIRARLVFQMHAQAATRLLHDLHLVRARRVGHRIVGLDGDVADLGLDALARAQLAGGRAVDDDVEPVA